VVMGLTLTGFFLHDTHRTPIEVSISPSPYGDL
jgi:hypothetical protein